jgi:hypothetical protein
MKWHDFPIDKAPYRFPENMVLFAENSSLDHRGVQFSDVVYYMLRNHEKQAEAGRLLPLPGRSAGRGTIEKTGQ